MPLNNGISLFGFEIRRSRKTESEEANRKSFVAPLEDDGLSYVRPAAGRFGQYIDLGGVEGSRSDADLIANYREISMHPECDSAIDDIVNEAIVSDADTAPVSLNTDMLEMSESIKKALREEFDAIVGFLQFNHYAYEIFRKWYIDGRIFYHIIVDEKNPKKGILELRPIEATRIRKIREIEGEPDPKTGANIIKNVHEYYLYQDNTLAQTNTGLKISKDAIQHTTSGLPDPLRKQTLSYLHKAIKPANQLRMMEDSLVIYRLARAPERRAFYVDVGNLPKGKAEEYLRSVMNQYRRKLEYEPTTGEIRDGQRHLSIVEDFWLPRREGGRGTEISTLPGGENLGQIEDVLYFQKRLYRSLNVPVNRLEQEAQFSLGRSTEITRDEVKFQRFVNRLRAKFSWLFLNLLKTQLLLKGIVNESDWNKIKEKISVKFLHDSHFAELKESELFGEQIEMVDRVDQHIGKYFSLEFVRKKVLKMTDEDIALMDKQIEKEKKSGVIPDDDEVEI